MPYNFITIFVAWFSFRIVIFLNISFFVGWICVQPKEEIDCSLYDDQSPIST